MPSSQNADTKTNFTNITVGPRTTRIHNKGIPLITQKTASVPDAKVGIFPLNDRMSRIERSDSLRSKMVRLVNVKEYKTFDTIYSKALIAFAIINLIMAIVFFSFYMASPTGDSTNLYVKDVLITADFNEKNKDMNTMNTVNKTNNILSGVISVLSFIASIGQFIYVYRHNDFRS
jgi:hypothetical protein